MARRAPSKALRIMLVSLLVVCIAFALFMVFGGEPVRRFGSAGGQLGDAVKERAESLGDKADRLRDDIRGGARDIGDDIADKARGEG